MSLLREVLSGERVNAVCLGAAWKRRWGTRALQASESRATTGPASLADYTITLISYLTWRLNTKFDSIFVESIQRTASSIDSSPYVPIQCACPSTAL